MSVTPPELPKSPLKVLFVCYLFPPVGGIGVQRPLKFVRYINQFGCQPGVLTAADVYSATMDHKLLEEIPNHVQVVRIKDIVSKWIGRFMARPSSAAISPTTSATDIATVVPTSFKSQLGRWLKKAKDLLLIPDESVLWALQAARKGQLIVRKKRISCIYTTSGPNSTHLAGLLIKQWTGIKWVADFRDPWTDNIHFQRTGMRKALELWLERQVFLHATAITTVTESFRDLFVQKYPHAAERIHVIRNGVDPADFPSMLSEPTWDGKFTIFYAGILYPERSPKTFFTALANLLQSGKIPLDRIRIQFAGVFDYPGKRDNQSMIEDLGLQPVVELLGYLSHSQVIAAMDKANALLLIGEGQAQSAMYIPGKLYEYLYARRPILALMQEGEGAQIIRNANAGIVVPPKDEQAAERAIMTLYQAYQEKQAFAPDEQMINQFSRVEQAKQLAELMHSLQ